jgi:hypothetical protein
VRRAASVSFACKKYQNEQKPYPECPATVARFPLGLGYLRVLLYTLLELVKLNSEIFSHDFHRRRETGILRFTHDLPTFDQSRPVGGLIQSRCPK